VRNHPPFDLKKKITFSLTVFVLVSLVLTGTAVAQVPYTSTPFGGKILFATYCNNGILLTIGPPKPGFLLFQWGYSTPYKEYQFYRSGPWALGNYITVPGAACVIGIIPIFVQGVIQKIGTSLF